MKAAKSPRAPSVTPAVAPVRAAPPTAAQRQADKRRQAEEQRQVDERRRAEERRQAEERRGMYMMWFDDSAKKTPSSKIEEAVEAYMRHFHARPNIVLVNETDRVAVTGVQVRCESYVRRDNFWVGYEDAA